MPYKYRIVGNFRGIKLTRIGRKGAFCRENVRGMLNWLHNGCGIFVQKIFMGGCKIAKFVKVFSLKSFLLCGMYMYIILTI